MPSPTHTPYKHGEQIADLLGLPPNVMLSALWMSSIRKVIEEQAAGLSSWPCLVGMGTKRCAEFLAGRLCAAQSLQVMGVTAPFPLPLRDRLPIWPLNVIGSISHCNHLAVALTAPKSAYRAVGIDVEAVIDARTAWEIHQSVGRNAEWAELEKYVPCLQQSLTQLFSAKEALYKALFPSVGHFKDFDAASLCSYEAGSLLLQLTHDWSSCWPAGTFVRVHQAWVEQVVVSAVCITQTHPFPHVA